VSAVTPPRTIRIGISGLETVVPAPTACFQDNREAISRKIGLCFEVAQIGVKDITKPRILPANHFTSDLQSIVDDPTIDVILELIGGVDPAGHLVEAALLNGKHVVTAANKELIAKQGSRLVHLAKSKGLDLHYEAQSRRNSLIQPF